MKCDETMVGFVQHSSSDTPRDEFNKTMIQCFYGILEEGASLEKTLERKAGKLFEEDPTAAALATKNILAGVKNHTIKSIDDIDQALSFRKSQKYTPKKSVYQGKKNEYTQNLNATISVQVNVVENKTNQSQAPPKVEPKPLTPQQTMAKIVVDQY